MSIDALKAVEILGQAAQGVLTLDENSKEACLLGKTALAREIRTAAVQQKEVNPK